jgi:prepilin-type processing-associated H-X9-DG protein
MNEGVGTIDGQFAATHSGHSGPPTQATMGPWLTGSQYQNKHNNPWATFGKSSDFVTIGAANIFLMVDESPWSIDDGGFAVCAGIPRWVNFPATFHNNACGFSFCDGHAEVHKWIGTSMVLNAPRPTGSSGLAVPASDTDWNWLVAHSTVKMN